MAVLLNEQPYKNNIRTVSGAVTVFDDDSILAVDTSGGACTIDLGIIPPKNWSTLYKLYIYDASGNASANNITINAAAGQTLNGQPTAVINVDDGAALLRIVGENRYSIVTTFSAGTLGGHVIEDEGNPLPQRPNLNFIGGGVEAYDDGLNNETVVDVIGGIVQLTNADMLNLISLGEVKKSQLYLITDCQFTDGGIVVTGMTEKSISREGRSFHLNADYIGTGDYSGVAGFTALGGLWNQYAISYIVGTVVIYDNLHYINVGVVAVGTPPPVDAAAWTVLPKSLSPTFENDQGYKFSVDFSIYDIDRNQLERRADNYRNIVDYANPKGIITFDNFPWGNPNFTDNRISGTIANTQGIMNQFIAEFKGNIIEDGAITVGNCDAEFPPTINHNYIGAQGSVNISATGANVWTGQFVNNRLNGAFGSVDNRTINVSLNEIQAGCVFNAENGISIPAAPNQFEIVGNVLSNGFQVELDRVDISNFDKVFRENRLSNTGKLTITSWTDLSFFRWNEINTIKQFTIENLNNNALQGGDSNVFIDHVISDFPVVVDFSNLAYYNAGTLDLGNPNPNQWNYVGRFLCINSAGLAVSKIVNAPVNIPFKLIPEGTPAVNDVTITYTAIGAAAIDDIINNSAFPVQTVFNYNSTASDEVEFELLNGNYTVLKNYKKLL